MTDNAGHTARSHPEEVQGVLNFVGGWVGAICPDAFEVNRTLFVRGAAFPMPMLWLYGEGDPYYSIGHSRANFDAFRAAGGQGSFTVMTPAKGLDGHEIYLQPSLWTKALDGILNSQR